MAFSEQSEKLTLDLIQAEYLNACNKFGEKYNSLHEGYAVLLEEIEEAIAEVKNLIIGKKMIWQYLKDYDPKSVSICLEQSMGLAEGSVENAIKELAQVGAVLMKIKNTLQSKEETTEKRKVCSNACEYINRAYGSYFCNGQKNAPNVNLGDDCYYNDRTEEPKF